MRHPSLLSNPDTVLVVVDVQQKLMNVIHERDRVIENTVKLIEAAKVLSIPTLATTQIAEKLGGFCEPVQRALSDIDLIDKTTFSCAGSERFSEALRQMMRKQVLICGVECHVCVNQTAHDLLAEGCQVHVATDAVSSRTPENWRAGVEKMRDSGCIITSTETAIFELTQDADRPEFRQIHKLVK